MSQPQPTERRVTTRASNTNKHPGVVDISPGSKPRKMSLTKAEREAENKKKREESEEKAARKLATLLTIAELQKDQKALQEAEMANALHPGEASGNSGASKAVIDIDSDFGDVFETSKVGRGRGVGSRGGRGG
jgi:hypothetical protein